MTSLKTIVIFLVASLALAAATPLPEPGGWGRKHHTHYIIHVPYHVHTVHHHHVKKVPIYIKEHHHDHHDHHDHHEIISSGHGWDWD